MEPKVILLVEDNPSDIELTRRAFEKCHIANEMIVVQDGQEALDFLLPMDRKGALDPAKMPAVVLLDLKLPKIDGLDVLRRLRADPRTKRLPVVILTSSDERRDLAQSYDEGANSYVRKPVDFIQFAEAIRQLGLYWLVLNEPPPVE